MNRLWAAAVGGAALVLAALLACTAGALGQEATGDSCTASGNGTAYTLHLTVAGGAQQFGFAFAASGATVTNAVIPGTNGSFSAQNLAPHTSGAWISDTPLTGSLIANVTTSGAARSFMIVPAASSQSSYFDAIHCATASTPAATAIFSVSGPVSYSAAARAWHLSVTVPAAGTVSASQLEPTIGTGSSKPVTAKALVQARRVVVKSAGTFTLVLRPTPDGQARLAATGAIKAKVHVVFDAKTGKSASKVLNLTLRK